MPYVMRVQISGTRETLDWPRPGQPVPADMGPAELADLVASGHVAKVARQRPEPVAAEPEPPEVGKLPEPETATARAPSNRRRR